MKFLISIFTIKKIPVVSWSSYDTLNFKPNIITLLYLNLGLILYSPFRSAFNQEEIKLKNHISSSQNSSNIIIFSDTDWIFDPFSLQNKSLMRI